MTAEQLRELLGAIKRIEAVLERIERVLDAIDLSIDLRERRTTGL